MPRIARKSLRSCNANLGAFLDDHVAQTGDVVSLVVAMDRPRPCVKVRDLVGHKRLFLVLMSVPDQHELVDIRSQNSTFERSGMGGPVPRPPGKRPRAALQ